VNATTIDEKVLAEVDRLVASGRFVNRSQAIQESVTEKLDRMTGARLALECAKLDLSAERSLAEIGLVEDVESWPTY
jgi:Arc/MetJ-type ribon-helix-helix transcriptional regulator